MGKEMSKGEKLTELVATLMEETDNACELIWDARNNLEEAYIDYRDTEAVPDFRLLNRVRYLFGEVVEMYSSLREEYCKLEYVQNLGKDSQKPFKVAKVEGDDKYSVYSVENATAFKVKHIIPRWGELSYCDDIEIRVKRNYPELEKTIAEISLWAFKNSLMNAEVAELYAEEDIKSIQIAEDWNTSLITIFLEDEEEAPKEISLDDLSVQLYPYSTGELEVSVKGFEDLDSSITLLDLIQKVEELIRDFGENGVSMNIYDRSNDGHDHFKRYRYNDFLSDEKNKHLQSRPANNTDFIFIYNSGGMVVIDVYIHQEEDKK